MEIGLNGMASLAARRPSWWRERADVELDCRLAGGDHPPVLSAALDAARGLSPGQVLSVRLDFEPVLLYQILAPRGFEHWAERRPDGDLRIDFYLR